MKLYIDTSEQLKITIGIDEKRFTAEARVDKSQRLLPFINEVLQKEKKTLQDIDEIEVCTIPGSFTGLRVGISVANTLGYVLGIKVNGQDVIVDGPVQPQY